MSTICRIEPFSTAETVVYIDYRLKLAGYEGEALFTEDALKLIKEASHGIARTVNNLCFTRCHNAARKRANRWTAAWWPK